MKLKNVLKSMDYEIIKGDCEVEITSVAYDSRKVKPGSLFVCVSGYQTDGHRYIGQAVEKGAVAILVTDPSANRIGGNIIRVKDAREALAMLSVNWFGHPAEKMVVIGVTGTKGKTTVTHMMKRIFESAGHKVGMIGTLGAYIGNEKIPTLNTTPESYELHSLFARMQRDGCRYVVMEVSSQALKLKRTVGIRFTYGVFLNLSPDHISESEHKDFTEYMQCKKLLFRQTERMVVNIDDSHWRNMMEGQVEYTTISCHSEADYRASGMKNLWEDSFLGVSFSLCGKLSAWVRLNMPGEYNVENALAAIAVTHGLGVGKEHILEGLAQVSVKGRTQLVRETSHFGTFIIDYAHNALAMEKLLVMLKSYHPARLICLFGAGGNKPRLRRYDMGQMAGKYADETILTTDNPRFESVEEINADIIRGLKIYNGKYRIIPDRAEAICYLIDHSRKGDIIVLVGKGHEEYQEIKGKRYYFSEEQTIRDYIETK